MAIDTKDPSQFTWPSPEVSESPYEFYEALRESAPVWKHPERNEYLVSRWEDIVYAGKHSELFSHEIHTVDPNLREVNASQESRGHRIYTPFGMASTDPPEHTIKRRFGLRLVARERLRGYEALSRDVVNELIDAFIDRGECDFRAEFGDLIPTWVTCDALGLPRADAPLFMKWATSESQGLRFAGPDRIAMEKQWVEEGYEYLHAALSDRVANPRDDFLSELVRVQVEQDGQIDFDYLLSESRTLLFAGIATTAHMLANTMLLLLRHPDELARVQADPSLSRGLIEESMRIESPLQWHMRICRQDTELRGVHIPEDAWVFVMYGAGNRDPDRFEEPEVFDVTRENAAKHQLGFGHGPHLCLGAPMARVEGRVAFEILLTRLKNIRLVEEQSDLRNIESTRFRAPRQVTIGFERA